MEAWETKDATAQALMAIAETLHDLLGAVSILLSKLSLTELCPSSAQRPSIGASTNNTCNISVAKGGRSYNFFTKVGNCLLGVGSVHSAFSYLSKN